MKRICTFFCIIAMAALTACGSGDTVPEQPPKSLSAEVEISDNGRQFSAKLSKDETDWEYVFTAPETIKGMRLARENGKIVTELEGLEFEGELSDLPESSPALLIVKTLDICSSGKGVTAKKDGALTVNEGTVEGADFTVSFEKGMPVSMEIGGEIAVSFNRLTGNR